MKKYWVIALGAMLIVAGGGCQKKEPPRTTPTTVMLESGKGAALVTFGKAADFAREEWMAQVFLEGAADTKALPRVPMSDIQATLVLNVEPGFYKVIGQAWKRGLSPYSGGSRDSVEVRAGEVTVLKGAPVGFERYPFPTVRLTALGREMWTVESPAKLQEFLASAGQKGVKHL